MLQSAVLDVAMGMVFVFLLVSLLVSAATELFASMLKWRASKLWDGVATLLQSESARTQLYDHPLIKGLAPRALNASDWKAGRLGPSYIPSRNFALALIDILREPRDAAARVHQEFESAVEAAQNDPSKIFDAAHSAITRVLPDVPPKLKSDLFALQQRVLAPADESVVNDVKATLRKAQPLLPPDAGGRLQKWLDTPYTAGDTYAAMRAELTAIVASVPAGDVTAAPTRSLFRDAVARTVEGDPNAAIAEISAFLGGPLRRWTDYAAGGLENTAGALWPMLEDAAGDIDRFRESIETWFNSGMDRVSGWYKRHTQAWQFGIAFALALALNIDSLLVVRTLWQDPALRQAIASQAVEFASTPPASLKPPPATVQDSTGQLNVELSQSTIDAGGTATAYLQLAGADANRTVDVAVTSGNLKILDANGQPRTSTKITVPVGQKASVTLEASPVVADSLEQIHVSRAGMSVQPQLVVRPSSSARFDTVKSQIGGLNLPIGWRPCAPAASSSATSADHPFWCSPPSLDAEWTVGVLALLLGWLITSTAASLGAPFWFDTLSRVASIRSAGKPPDEPPKPAKGQ